MDRGRPVAVRTRPLHRLVMMKKWEVDIMYRPPSLVGGVKNGFQGVPERYKWVPHAMLANRRFRAGYPFRGLCTVWQCTGDTRYNFLFFIIKISTLFCQTVI